MEFQRVTKIDIISEVVPLFFGLILWDHEMVSMLRKKGGISHARLLLLLLLKYNMEVLILACNAESFFRKLLGKFLQLTSSDMAFTDRVSRNSRRRSMPSDLLHACIFLLVYINFRFNS